MRILIASDAFKDALAAPEVCARMAAGIQSALPDAEISTCPLADGGEGTFEVLAEQLRLETVWVDAVDPLFRPIRAPYGINTTEGIAVIEMAKTAGLQLLPFAERNPMFTTTTGVGYQIKDALEKGVRRIMLAIGGSATNDAGIGMATALGWRFLDQNDLEISPIGNHLSQIRTIHPPSNRPKVQVDVICDVTNPLFGPSGAARVYARQKGASDSEIALLDAGLQHFASVAQDFNPAIDPHFPGAGAAGGMGYGSMFFLGAKLWSGINLVMDLVAFEKKLESADLVITGEGKIDHQTARGKLVQGICRLAAQHQKPVVALCGMLEASEADVQALGLSAAFSINDPANRADLTEMLRNTGPNLEKKAREIFSEGAPLRKRFW